MNEFVLARREKVVPLGQVMGNSVYRLDVGVAGQRLGVGEIKALMRPLLDVYLQAIARLRCNAQRLSADAVIGIRLEETRTSPELWRLKNVLTVRAIGTAVSLGADERREDPVLMAGTGQEYYTLRRAGFRPAGLVFGQSVYYQGSQGMLLFSHMPYGDGLPEPEPINPSIERADYTRAVTKARQLAMQRMEAEAIHRQAEGVVGVSVKMRPSWLPTGLVMEIMVMGNAIVSQARPQSTIRSSLTLTD